MPTETTFTAPENGFYALVELFGHQRIVGFVSEYQLGGESFVRVDVPQIEDVAGFTRLFGKGAIYAINPLTEDVAKRLAVSVRAVPLHAYALPAQIEHRRSRPGDDFEDDENDD